ncbi:unnamed protein product [Calypogeia fissa]
MRGDSEQGGGSPTSLDLNGFQENKSTIASPIPMSPPSISGAFEVVTNSEDALVDYSNSVLPSHTPTSQASTPASPSMSTKYKILSSSRSSRSCSTRSLQEAAHDKATEYSGMPKVDDDIEVGKKITRRRKLSTQRPPSSNHVDVQPPSLSLVQQALCQHKVAGARRFKRPQSRAVATEFHDEKGHMFLYGSEAGKYIGDVLGGLPHGHGQHWIPKRCFPCGGPTGEICMLYEGAWEYGSKHGFGRMIYTDGQEYRGHFKGGERHGHGTMSYADGSIFDGEWEKGRKHGLGSCYYGDGGIFKGAYCKDNRDGWGIYYWPNKCRKYEGEWVGNDPVCGNATSISEEEYDALIETIPDWCELKSQLICPLPQEQLLLPFQTLRNPELCYYPHVCARRQYRIDLRREALTDPPDPKIIVEHKGSLTPQQMQGLHLAFDKLSPGYYRRTMVNRVQIRRLILLARLDPDSEVGKLLFAKLMEATSQTVGLTYNNFMKTILSFQHPPLF